MQYLTEFFILLMLSIVFLQSGIDKAMDWKGNLEWLTGHFAKSPLRNMVPMNLGIIMILEILAGSLALLGAIVIMISGNPTIAITSAILSAITFIMLFFGQRIAKDYPGAQSIVIYLIPTFFLIYLLTN